MQHSVEPLRSFPVLISLCTAGGAFADISVQYHNCAICCTWFKSMSPPAVHKDIDTVKERGAVAALSVAC